MSVQRSIENVLFLLLLLLPLGCSWFVDPLAASPRCSVDAGDGVCPQGLRCEQGVCKKSCAEREVCDNRIDDDCDDAVDERNPEEAEVCGDRQDNDCDREIDEYNDIDHDGYQICGDTVPQPDGSKRVADCDDVRNDVHPDAPELCDNIDNDCDRSTDEAAPDKPLCEQGLVCKGRCIKPSCALEDPSFKCGGGLVCDAETGQCVLPRPTGCGVCPEGQECNAATSQCQPRPKLPNGRPCVADSDCRSGTCIDAAALRLTGRVRVCGQACCDDTAESGCPEGERCFASGTGARSCLPLDMLPASLTAQCTTDRSCTTGQQCGLESEQLLSEPNYTPVRELTTSVCRPPPAGGRKLGEYCILEQAQACASHTCVTAPIALFICSVPCGTSDDCAAFAKKAPVELFGSYCRYVQAHSPDANASRPADYASVCVVRRNGDTGAGTWGTPCTSGQECSDRGCIGATAMQKGQCLPTCCHNRHCGPNEQGVQKSCRPFAVGSGYEMRCEPITQASSAEPH